MESLLDNLYKTSATCLNSKENLLDNLSLKSQILLNISSSNYSETTIVDLRSHANAPYFNHAFCSPTYEKSKLRLLKKHLEKSLSDL